MQLGGGSTFIANTVDDSGDGGFGDGLVSGAAGATFKDNTVRGSTGRGIVCTDCVLNGNTIQGNSNFGALLVGDSAYGNNLFTDNNGGNGNAQLSGGVEAGTNVCATNTSCP